MQTIAEAIKSVRVQHQLTQQEVANRLHCAKAYISMIESGKRIPSDLWLAFFCKEFGVDEVVKCREDE